MRGSRQACFLEGEGGASPSETRVGLLTKEVQRGIRGQPRRWERTILPLQEPDVERKLSVCWHVIIEDFRFNFSHLGVTSEFIYFYLTSPSAVGPGELYILMNYLKLLSRGTYIFFYFHQNITGRIHRKLIKWGPMGKGVSDWMN